MKFSESWLREWVDPPIDSEQLAQQLTMAGLEVDGIEAVSAGFADVVIARVERIRPHPRADRLSICTVNYGARDPTDIVCGAENVQAGRYYPLARPGATLATGANIAAHEIRGVVSNGMLCSAAELGLADDADKLFELVANSAIQPGTDLNEFLRLDDTLIELSLTPNRGDCLSLGGIAREVAVLNEMEIRPPDIPCVPAANNLVRAIKLAAPVACPRYAGRIIQAIDMTRPSPGWLTEKLRRCGIRSINAVVDISNYVMLESGQPTHAFDNDKLTGAITVRHAKEQEQLTLLDGQRHKLLNNTLVIADETSAVALAGIMGGLATAVTDNTRNIFLESAFFTPLAIAGRARQFGLHTDASHRYERGVDYRIQTQALERMTQLTLEICGGEPGPLVEVCSDQHLPSRRRVALEYAQVERLLGKEISASEIQAILTRLGLSLIDNEHGLEAEIPSFRFDLQLPEDLIEEIVRIHGYQRIPCTAVRTGLRMRKAETRLTARDYRQVLVSRDYHEAITYSFVDRNLQGRIMGKDNAIALLNPIASDMGVMRQSLWPGLLQALEYNLKRQRQRVRLFEQGLVFHQQHGEVLQTPMLAGLIHGKSQEKQWNREAISCDFFDIKGDIEALLALSGNDTVPEYVRIDDSALHPGRSARVILNDQTIGKFGAAHPSILRKLGLPGPVYLFELEYGKISAKKGKKFTKISKFPSIRRDLSLLVDKEITVASVINCVENSASELLQNLELFDVYQGEGIDIKQKSLTLGLTFQGTFSTLKDAEIEDIMARVLDSLHSKFGATLRA